MSVDIIVPIVNSKDELSAVIRNSAVIRDSKVSFVDYQFETSTFSLGIISAPASETSPVYFFQNGRSLTMPDHLKAEIISVIPNAKLIDQGAAKNLEDNPNFLKPREIYSAEVAHAEVQKAVKAKLNDNAKLTVVPVKVGAEPLKAARRFGLFNKPAPIPGSASTNEQSANKKRKVDEIANTNTKDNGPANK